jgi:Cu+-exporting ATPase
MLIKETLQCFHCGDSCDHDEINFDQHSFCCVGCKNVYELLSQNNLCDYYQLDNHAGIAVKNPILPGKFDYLDDEQVQRKLVDFKDNNITKISFFIPNMHCSSCIWLLEQLFRLNTEVTASKVNFPRKTLSVTYTNKTSLKNIVRLLSSIGYEPAINLSNIESDVKKDNNRKLIYQIGVAGFCFGNIMLISFPEYFGLDVHTRMEFSKLFGGLNMILSIPVFLYSAQDYFIAAWKGIRKNIIGIDVPLALGIFVLFVRSAYEIITESGIGYFDTHAGLVFFLLIGKWFQQKTYDTMSFERDYKSYFPVASNVIKNEKEYSVPVTNLEIGERIIVRNNELIPADAILLKGEASIDFSFVTGESMPVKKVLGEMVYAGGKQMGQAIELEVIKKVSQSYLTQLWNNELFNKSNESRLQTFQQSISRYFTYVLLLIAFGSASWWLYFKPELALHAFTSVLIIACPCALALSSPFALGTAMRILGKRGFFLKSPEVVEHIAKSTYMVFDKTGTITQPSESTIKYIGNELDERSKHLISNLTKNSVHPLSKKIHAFIGNSASLSIKEYTEIPGKGIQGVIDGTLIAMGSAAYLDVQDEKQALSTRVYLKMNEVLVGYFELAHSYRNGMKQVLDKSKQTHKIELLSGDNENEQAALLPFFETENNMHFNQSPLDKLNRIEHLKKSYNVMMIGDGLNDAGALKAADVGISITENTAQFSPASDVIMDARQFSSLPDFIQFTKRTLQVIHMSFVLSLLYNIIGLSYAVQGILSPVIAAILMPISSISVIVFTTSVTALMAKKGGIK